MCEKPRIAKFDALEPQRCKGTMGTEVSKIGLKRFGTFEKEAPGPCCLKIGPIIHALLFVYGIYLLEKYEVSQVDVSKLSQNTIFSIRINQNGEISQVVVYFNHLK